MKTILIIGTLDTKGEEVRYLKDAIAKNGMGVLILDCGMGGMPLEVKAEIPRETVAQSAGYTYDAIEAMGREQAEEAMAKGVAATVKRLYRENKFHGVLGLGGSDGTILATAGMRELPIGVPKFMISAMACGDVTFGEYVGSRDITIMPSVADVAGVNIITRKIFDNAAGAICGMVNQGEMRDVSGENQIALTMFGQTTPCGSLGRKMLEEAGYKVVTFHPNRATGPIMEDLITDGWFCGVWDLTTQEITDDVVSKDSSERGGRLTAAAAKGIPTVVGPGCMDIIWGPPENLEKFKNRKQMRFNRRVLLGKVTKEEISQAASVMAERLNRSVGPTAVLLPLRGISMYDREGEEFYSPDLDAVLFQELRNKLGYRVQLMEVDAHINDAEYAQVCVSVLLKMLACNSSQKK